MRAIESRATNRLFLAGYRRDGCVIFSTTGGSIRSKADCGWVRDFIHAMIERELDMALSRPRYARHAKSPSGEAEETVGVTGHRHGHRSRSLMGSFGRVEIEVPRARLNTADGKTTEWKSKALRAYQRRTLVADALIAGAYLAGTNTRRVRRAPPPCLAARSARIR